MKELSLFLQNELMNRKQRNPRYSLRSFAKALKIDPSTLSQILDGRRQCSRSKADLLLNRLGLPLTSRLAVIGPAPVQDVNAIINEKNFNPWPADADRCMREWLSYAVLSCFELKDFSSNTTWFAKRLNCPAEKIEEVLQMLEENRLIDRTNEKWTFQHAALTSNGTDAKVALDIVLKAYIQRAVDHLDSNPCSRTVGVDNFSGATLSIPIARLPEAIDRLTRFRREFCMFLTGGEESLANDEVYRLNIQLFPLTQVDADILHDDHCKQHIE